MPGPSDPVGVTLTPATAYADYRWAGAVRLRVDATAPVGWDGAVFLYRTSPVDVRTGVAAHAFMGVCGVLDLADWPAGEPAVAPGGPAPGDAGGPPPFFRAAAVELDLPTPARAATVWAVLREEVGLLARGVRALRRLTAGQPVVVRADTDPCPPAPAPAFRLTATGGLRRTEAGVPRVLEF